MGLKQAIFSTLSSFALKLYSHKPRDGIETKDYLIFFSEVSGCTAISPEMGSKLNSYSALNSCKKNKDYPTYKLNKSKWVGVFLVASNLP